MLHKFDHRQNDIFTIEYVRIDHKMVFAAFFLCLADSPVMSLSEAYVFWEMLENYTLAEVAQVLYHHAWRIVNYVYYLFVGIQ